MKKLFLLVFVALLSVSVYSQKGVFSGQAKGGLQTDPGRFGLGIEGRYNITDPIRVAADFIFMFPKDHTIGLDINLNAHYVFKVAENCSVYPLAGLNMGNRHYSHAGYSNSKTDWGFNLGGGFDYDLNAKSYLNAEFKYTIADWNRAHIMFGYGIRF